VELSEAIKDTASHQKISQLPQDIRSYQSYLRVQQDIAGYRRQSYRRVPQEHYSYRKPSEAITDSVRHQKLSELPQGTAGYHRIPQTELP
jgi:hypothetical protein